VKIKYTIDRTYERFRSGDSDPVELDIDTEESPNNVLITIGDKSALVILPELFKIVKAAYEVAKENE
jgi:hypothetical protein